MRVQWLLGRHNKYSMFTAVRLVQLYKMQIFHLLPIYLHLKSKVQLKS